MTTFSVLSERKRSEADCRPDTMSDSCTESGAAAKMQAFGL